MSFAVWVRSAACAGRAAGAACLLGSILVLGAGSRADALDCTKATTAVERAICASPALMEQDAAMAKAYADRLAQDPARAAAVKAEQRAWLTQRERLCGTKPGTPARLEACLAGSLRGRLAALGTSPAAVPPTAPPALVSKPVAAAPASPVVPQAPVVPTAVLPGPPAATLPDLPGRTPDPDASLARTTTPSAGLSDVLLDVRVPGRFSIAAKSASGVALQLVDMIAGPGDQKGEPGQKDGRIDALLDRGTYKLRITGAIGATGEAQLAVKPFRDAADIANALVYGGETEATLADLEQRSFWVAVGKPGHVSVEAVGRSLADLRLWRNGTDLSELNPVLDRVAPSGGHAMTRARIEGDVEPGLYLVTAYGGPKLVWADGSAAEPLVLHVGTPEPLAGGWIEGVVGPTGSVRFVAPDHASVFRLELPDPAPATLSVRHGSDAPVIDTLAKNSRGTVAKVESAAGAGRVVEVSGQAGQPFRLRALDPSASRQLSGAGPHWVGVDVAGEGGDDLPATVVLAQFHGDRGGRVLASNAPQVGPGKGWRQKINLRGKSTLLFEVTAPLLVGVTGVGAEPVVTPLLGNATPRSDGKAPRWNLEAGWYTLRLNPIHDATGILDVTLGPPGLVIDAKPQPPRPTVPLGLQSFDRGADYQILTNDTPTLVTAPYARALPADLEAEPLILSQAPGQALDIPVRVPPRGFLAAAGVNGIPVAVQRLRETTTPKSRTLTLHIPAPDRPRAMLLSWSDPAPPEADSTRLPAPSEPDSVTAGQPRFFDLARDGTRSFALDVPNGGLYRVETLGRLHTRLAVATAFLPKLDTAEANGAGENALAQSYLRAGRYRVLVKATDSSGRAGLMARAATLPEAGSLVPDGSARASLADGRGAVFPIEIAEAGRYRLDLYALGEPLRARLEDAEGWPLTVPGPTAAIERRFEPGRYRLVVLPEPVEARAVARLTRIVAAPTLAGHGPHPLVADKPTAFRWREPASTSEARDPDRWTFDLQGPGDVTLDLSGGMVGTLARSGASQPLARLVEKSGFAGRLEAGHYEVDALSLGRNDRLDYKISLQTKEIQPGVARRVELPATVPFAIATSRVVSLTSFGRIDLNGVLKDADGHVVERLGGRTSDWNIALSRLLPAGAYTLSLSAADTRPAKTDDTGAAVTDETDTADKGNDEAAAPEPDDADQPPIAEQPGDQNADAGTDDAPEATEPDTKPGETTDGKAAEDTDADTSDKPAKARDADVPDTEVDATGVELHLALPEPIDHPALAADGDATASGGDVHRFALPAVPAGQLLAVSARAGQDLVLSLERGDAQGHWDVAGFERGPAPLLAVPSDGDVTRPWRASVWAVDGGPAQMTLGVRAVQRTPVATGSLELPPVGFGDSGPAIAAALIAAPSSGLLSLRARPDGLLEGSVPGQVLQPVTDRTLVPQAQATWLVARAPRTGLAIEPATMPEDGLSLTVPAGGQANLPATPASNGTVTLWRADSTFGQPGLAAGHGFGVAPGSAVALGGDAPLRVWNAAGAEPLALRLATMTLRLREGARADPDFAAPLPKLAAQPVALPPGRKRLTLDLAPGTAGILGRDSAASTTVWAGAEAISRTLEGDWTEMLALNTADEPRPVHILLAPAAATPTTLAASAVLKRFFGAAGSLSVPVTAAAGDKLVVAGAEATFVGEDGRVARGGSLAPRGPGELVLEHGPGLVAAWIERAGQPAWPEAKAETVTIPSAVPLAGDAMALTFDTATPVLLHARTSAPVILSLDQGSTAGEAQMFPAGAELHRLVAPGKAALRLYSPHDGPLGGTLELTASPVTPARDGVGEPMALAPGGSALFGFEVRQRSPVGVGVRAEPDGVAVRLLDQTGRSLGTGVAQLQTLEPGRYVLEASVPPEGRPTVLRPAIVGLALPPSGPPEDVVRHYLELVGLAPTAPSR